MGTQEVILMREPTQEIKALYSATFWYLLALLREIGGRHLELKRSVNSMGCGRKNVREQNFQSDRNRS